MLRPQTEAELAEMVSEAMEPLRIQGGGTRPMGAVAGVGAVLSTAELSGIELYEPGALTMVARAGTPVEEIEAALAEEGQALAFEPMDHRGLLGTEGTPTIGGVFAANVSGPRRIQCGAARDFLLGVRFVNGLGQVIRNGGRVMKNVTGYDLVKLMAGSRGTLGVLTEVSFKVLPGARATATLRAEGLTDEQAVRALCQALGSPYQVTGAAHLQRGPEGAPMTVIRIEGSEASVAYRASQLPGLLSGKGAFAVERDADRSAEIWRQVRDVVPYHGREGDVWRLSVKPTDAPGIVARIMARMGDVEAIHDWGGGLVWLLVPEGAAGAEIRRAVAEAGGGHATLIRGRGEAVFQPLAPAIEALQEQLRRRFDPKGIFNPGLMGRAA